MFKTVWVEIPVSDIERAAKFYGQLLEKEFEIADDSVRKTVILADGSDGAGVSLNQSANFEPGEKGPLIYIQAADDLNTMLSRAEASGAKVLIPKTSMGASGFFATFRDSEGNSIALYSQN